MPYAKTKDGSLVNEVTLGDGYPLSNDLKPLKIGGEASILEISSPLPDGSDNGKVKVRGDLEVTGGLNFKNDVEVDLSFDDLSLSGDLDVAGRVGIGVTDPDSKVEIIGEGDSNSTKSLEIKDSGGQNLFYVRDDGVVSIVHGYLFAQASSGIYSTGSIKARGGITDDFGSLGLGGNGNTDDMTISNGNVGIGTTSPQADLHINNTSGTALYITASDSNPANAAAIRFAEQADGANNYFELDYNGNLNTLTFNSNNQGDMFTLDRSNNRIYTDTAKVGIGKGSGLKNKFQIYHTAADSDNGMMIIRDDTSTADGDLLGAIGFDSTDGNIPSSVLESSAFIAAYAAEDQGTGDKGADLVFGATLINDDDDTVSHEYMRILDNGNVGIGTTSPGAALEVKTTGDTLCRLSTDGDAGDVAHLQLYRNNLAYAQFHYEADGGTNAGLHLTDFRDSENAHIIFNTRGDNERMRIESDGKVGIGLAAPTTTLDVEGTVSYKHTAFTTAGPTDNVDVSDTTVLECDTSGGHLTIGGFSGGVQGQILYVVKTTTDLNRVILENNEGGGSQDIFLSSGADLSISLPSGIALYCNGSDWFALDK